MGVYGTQTLLCGDQCWQYAVQRLLKDANLVLMDLCGFSEQNQGCIFELGLLVDRIATHRFVLLVDESTDLNFLRSTLSLTWERMALDSPNRQDPCGPIRLFRLEQEYSKNGVVISAVQRNSELLTQSCAPEPCNPCPLQLVERALDRQAERSSEGQIGASDQVLPEERLVRRPAIPVAGLKAKA